MTRQIMLRATASSGDRRQLLLDNGSSGRKKVRLAEVAGGTTADCAAVCCCCPCGIAKILVLTVYKLPAGLCRKALRKQRHRRLLKKGEHLSSSSSLSPTPPQCCCKETEFHVHRVPNPHAIVDTWEGVSEDTEVIELEKEMWDKFYGAGFWRSPSQRTEISSE